MAAKKRSVTMTDVAAHAGVSVKTVSNVINDWPYVTDETRRRVVESIEATGYRPNHMARSLVTGRTLSIGVMIPDISNPFFGASIRGCEDVLFEAGYSLFLCNTNENEERERYYLEQLLSRGVDALILWGTRIRCEDLEGIVGTEIALVTVELGEQPTGPNHTCINVDNLHGGRIATDHLIAVGRQRIAHLSGLPSRITSELRRRGYEQALQAARIPPEPELIVAAYPTIQGGFRAAMDVIEAQQPDAFFCYNDLMALGAVLAARHLGLSIPDDLALVGFDDIEMASLIDPPLTTVRIQQHQLGRLAGQAVLDSIRTPGSTSKVVLSPVELKVRGSSSPHHPSAQQCQLTLDSLISSFAEDTSDAGPNVAGGPATS